MMARDPCTDTGVDWLVSDVIAYPERVTELLERWCGNQWAKRMVVTMKFQGDPDWAALEQACEVAAARGYAVRVKHFFSNKNEVTLMLVEGSPSPQEGSA